LPLLLASRSPRRAALLRDAGIPFSPGPCPDVDETPPRDADGALLAPDQIVTILARRKALAAHEAALDTAPDAFLLSADTLVFLEGRPLGKPADEVEATAMLAALSGRWHEVWTGVAICSPGSGPDLIRHVLAVCTRIRFRALSPAEIETYVRSGEPMDKAGAYAIQGGAAGFVAERSGPLDNVIGLPVGRLRALLSGLSDA
jgi:septum formation protein